jgi:hypothetical protein
VRARMCDARKRLAEWVELCTYALALNSRSPTTTPTKSGAAPERLRLGAKLFAIATSAGIRDRTPSFERSRKFHP